MYNHPFTQARDKILNSEKIRKGIGTLSEKTLHVLLKHYLEPDEEKHEIKTGAFVADIYNDKGITEIQTRSFDKLRKKLEAFLTIAPVTVVYPIAHTKWLYWIDKDSGEITKKRKSPKRGTPYEAFFELYKIKPFLLHENFRLCILLLDMEEYRYLDGWSGDRKKGSSRCERIPVDFIEEITIHNSSEYGKLLPPALPLQFTTKDFKGASGLSLSNAQTALNVLHAVGVVKRAAKRGNAHVYERN